MLFRSSQSETHDVASLQNVEPLQPVTSPTPTAPSITLIDIERLWPNVIAVAKNTLPSLGVLLTSSRPLDFKNNTLTLHVAFAIHKQQLAQTKIRTALDTIFRQTLGIQPKIIATVEANSPTMPNATPSPAETAPILSQALAALGGRLVTEE